VIIYSLVIMMLNKAYRQIAEYLTGPPAPPSLLSPSGCPTLVNPPCSNTHTPTWTRTRTRALADLENHRLARDYETSLILKRVLFESFDCYAVLLYIAFYQFNCTRLRNEVCALLHL